jgi:lipid-A-disaccharide synthase
MQPSSFNHATQKVWLFAGEASGDLYGAHLTRELKTVRPELTILGMGGAEMRRAGVEIMVDSTELGVVGLVEVLKHYPMFRRIFNGLVERAELERPDLVVLIDYPGFNLRFAEQMRKRGIPVVYYICPQVWAWGKKRIPKIARDVQHMLVIFPFEQTVFDHVNLPTTFVGHPLVDILDEDEPVERDDKLIAILPGSRFSEVNRLAAPLFRTVASLHKAHPEYHYVIPVPRQPIADRLQEIMARSSLPDSLQIKIAVGETPYWQRRAIAGIAASGTVTVQSAILGLPLVVVYKVNPLSYFLWSRLVKIDYITMVNLVAGKCVFEEYLQGDVCPEVLVPALQRILPGGERRQQAEEGIVDAVQALGGSSNASRRAAEAVINILDQQDGD